MSGPNDLTPANTSNLYPVLIDDSGQAGVYSTADLAQYVAGNDLTVPGNALINGSARVAGDMYAAAYHGYNTTGAVIIDNGGTPLSFWTSGADFHVQSQYGGDICAFSGFKTFVIDHPTDPDRLLVHACLEGPEAAVFYRGEALLDINGKAVVMLPDYFDALTVEGSPTVQVTQILEDEWSPVAPVAATRVKDGCFVVRGAPRRSVAWRVEATRRDGEIEIEPLRKDVRVCGEGPYTWIQG